MGFSQTNLLRINTLSVIRPTSIDVMFVINVYGSIERAAGPRSPPSSL